MKILFIIFHGFNPSNGISKKISYQLDAFRANGHEAHLCYMDETSSKKRIVDSQVIVDYGNGIKGKILKRTEFSSIVDYAIKAEISFVYIRSNHNANPFTIRMVKRMKKAGMKVVMEIPTFPYDAEYRNWSFWRKPQIDKLFRNSLANHLDAIITFSNDDFIFGQRTIKISNGIDFGHVSLKKSEHNTLKELNLIGVAEIHDWHGFDRVIKGLADYYSKPHDITVYFHVVGYFFSIEAEKHFKDLIKFHQLEKYVILHGKKHGKELDDIFNICDFGIGSLGRHRAGIKYIKTLKNREYAARGIAFSYSETDTDFDDKPYVLKFPAKETPIDINKIIEFHKRLKLRPDEIRNSIQHLSWSIQMQRIINELYPKFISDNKIKIAYCIPLLDRASGMERVLTIKANYLADVLSYDITIILTDGKGNKPYFPLSDKIRIIQLDVNIDFLWQYPIWKRIIIYRKRIKDYHIKIDICLNWLKPDITISLMRREINFINKLKDGSIKMGEIHFARYKYREVNITFLPKSINRLLSELWIKQLENNAKKLKRFIVLTEEDAKGWRGFKNICVISNPITIYSTKKTDCTSKQVITVGRYSYEKGYDMLIEAWKTINKKHPEWSLQIYGAGNKHAYEESIKDNGLSESITCHEATNNIIDKYLESSIYVLSSRFEGFSLVLGEAMSLGIPPVAFACPYGPIAIIHDGEDGILCENGNIQQLADGICKLIEDENLRKEMGRKAAINIQRYSLDNIMQQWDHLFKEVIRERDEKDLLHS